MEFVRPCHTIEQIGKLIRLKRVELGYSVEKLASNLSLEANVLVKIEEGRKAMTSKEFKKISHFLETDVKDLTKLQVDKSLVFCRGTKDSNVERTIERAQIIFHEFLGQKLLQG